jgi:hypothetical protein
VLTPTFAYAGRTWTVDLAADRLDSIRAHLNVDLAAVARVDADLTALISDSRRAIPVVFLACWPHSRGVSFTGLGRDPKAYGRAGAALWVAVAHRWPGCPAGIRLLTFGGYAAFPFGESHAHGRR